MLHCACSEVPDSRPEQAVDEATLIGSAIVPYFVWLLVPCILFFFF